MRLCVLIIIGCSIHQLQQQNKPAAIAEVKGDTGIDDDSQYIGPLFNDNI